MWLRKRHNSFCLFSLTFPNECNVKPLNKVHSTLIATLPKTNKSFKQIKHQQATGEQHGDLFDGDQTVAHTTPEIWAQQLPSAAPSCGDSRRSHAHPAAPAPAPPSVATLCATLYAATRLPSAHGGRGLLHARQDVRRIHIQWMGKHDALLPHIAPHNIRYLLRIVLKSRC